jgi:hypothetical protein
MQAIAEMYQVPEPVLKFAAMAKPEKLVRGSSLPLPVLVAL